MADIYKKRIVGLLKHTDYQPVRLSQVAKTLGVDSEDYAEFKEAFDQLRRAGHVIVGARNLITLPSLTGQTVGTFTANPKGFGFVTPREPHAHGDLFIAPGDTAEAMTGDTVLARVKKQGKRAGQVRYSGEVLQIIERAQNRFIGTLQKHPDGWIVLPDSRSFFEPIAVDDITAKDAKEKDKVVIEILVYPTDTYLARGVITEVLGRSGQYDTEIKSVIRRYHLPTDFDADCRKQASQASAGFDPENATGRDDITDKTIVTIDPPDAKDFDDAISLERDADGNWVLGVHIADVSNFIEAGSTLDIEAKARGNSVYLPQKTIPMLPEILSNGVCSLQPKQKRFCKTAYITYDDDGNILSRKFANTVILSKQRLTYEQADRVLKGHTKGTNQKIIKLLKNMEALSGAIEKRRRANGMLHLDLPETELVFDKAGQVVDAHPADDSYPHTIIEMFMVEANDAAASLLDKLNFPLMRRIHPEPDALSLKNLAKLVRAFGFSMPRNPDRAAIQDLLAAVKGRDFSFAVNLTVLRSFEKAQYAPTSIGHWALASRHYCHFTSPIRRYADLLVHRVLECHIQGRKDLAKDIAAELDLVEIGNHITFTEQQADHAEKELTNVLTLQMLSKKIGTELDCVVTGLTGFGVFAQSRKFGIEGLILLSDLGEDQWKLNRKTQCIIGERSGCTVRLGQAIHARIISVNLPGRQLNLAPVEPLIEQPVTAPAKRKPARRRRTQRSRR